jgi:hypothetical protein
MSVFHIDFVAAGKMRCGDPVVYTLRACMCECVYMCVCVCVCVCAYKALKMRRSKLKGVFLRSSGGWGVEILLCTCTCMYVCMY